MPSRGTSLWPYPEWVLRSYWHFAISFSVVILLFFGYWMWKVREKLPEEDKGLFHAITKTYEVLVCDEPDLAWPGRKEAERLHPNWSNSLEWGGEKKDSTFKIRHLKHKYIDKKRVPPADKKFVMTSSMKFTITAARSTGKDLSKPSGSPQHHQQHKVTLNFKEISADDYTVFAHTMRLMALLHLAFLGIFFWDAMRQK